MSYGSVLSLNERNSNRHTIRKYYEKINDESLKDLFNKNHHIRQAMINNYGMSFVNFDSNTTPFLDDLGNTEHYRSRSEEIKTVDHWGQRKLLFSEIKFLLMLEEFHPKVKTIVYAGAAPGTHLDYLNALFPNFNWILIDPRNFSEKILDRDDTIRLKTIDRYYESKFIVIKDYFDDFLAKRINRFYSNIAFISDIRTNTDNESIANDMIRQKNWVELLQPELSILKLRFPYPDLESTEEDEKNIFPYLPGKILLPVWGPVSTTETRLLVERKDIFKTKNYNTKRYESLMFYFNTRTRTNYYQDGLNMNPFKSGLCHCFDCRSEIDIIRTYLGRDDEKDIENMSMQISLEISKNRTLKTGHEFF